MASKKGGLVFGVIMGTLLGVLFAPKKGKDLRKQFESEMKKGGIGGDTLKQNFTEMGKDIAKTAEIIYQQPEVQKQIKKGKKNAEVFLKNALQQVDIAQDEIEKVGKKYYGIGQEKFDEAREHIEDGIQMVKKRIMEEVPMKNKATSKKKTAASAKKSKPVKKATKSKSKSSKKK